MQCTVFIFFSTNNFNHKRYLKTILELRIKQRFLLNLYINVPDLLFDFCCAETLQNFWKFDIAFCSSHKKILFSVLYINMWIYVHIVSICSNTIECLWKRQRVWHASVYSIDSTSLRFDGQVTKSVVPILLLNNN